MQKIDVSRFLDDQMVVGIWPRKQADKELVIAYLASKFELRKQYHENEVNELLKSWHSFHDWPMLRRELYERGYLTRNISGTVYVRLK